ncbi:MAG: threonine ammonia-lyase IlvA [Patescibacteria group bacterium]
MKHKLGSLVEEAMVRLTGVVPRTPLEFNPYLSRLYGADVLFKREDRGLGRSFKSRGSFNRISLLDSGERHRGVVCASAGNHAQGVALSCQRLEIKGWIYMPKNTSPQKIARVKDLGGKWVSLVLVGETYDEACVHARAFTTRTNKVFIHPFDDLNVIAGQGTVALEILEQLPAGHRLDFLLTTVGGGGLIAGTGGYLESRSPKTKLIGVEPSGAPSMSRALAAGKVVTLEKMDTFVGGAAVRTVGALTFEIARPLISQVVLVDEGRVCQEMVRLHQQEGIVTEPAGALTVAALEQIKSRIRGKTVVCVISGGNQDINQWPEITRRSLVYQGLRQYFIIELSQRPGELKAYLNKVLQRDDDITLLRYQKHDDQGSGLVLIAVDLGDKKELGSLLRHMSKMGLTYEHLTGNSRMFRLLVS